MPGFEKRQDSSWGPLPAPGFSHLPNFEQTLETEAAQPLSFHKGFFVFFDL